MVATSSAQVQTYSIIHNFTGGDDGATPRAGLTIDAAGNFYGTTAEGGTGYGIVFELKRSGSGWVLTPLYSFTGGNEGAHPWGRVAIGKDGTLSWYYASQAMRAGLVDGFLIIVCPVVVGGGKRFFPDGVQLDL